MNPKICIVGYDFLINIAKQVASQFRDEAEFIFINCVMEEALPFLREVEGVADIVVSGRSTKRLFSGHLKFPFITFRPSLPDFIQAIQGARKFDNWIALVLTLKDPNFDIPLLSSATNVSFLPFYAATLRNRNTPAGLQWKKVVKLLLEEVTPSRQLRRLD